MSLVLTEDHGPVRHLVLNRPEKRNALNDELILAIREAAARPPPPTATCCCVVSAARARCSRPAWTSAAWRRWPPTRGACASSAAPILETWNLLEEMAKPTICQVHGACIGGAMELALACDLRVMAADALIGMPETRVGLIPDVGGSSRLPAVVGLGRAKELVMTGQHDRRHGGRAHRPGQPRGARRRARRGHRALVGELLACAPVAVGHAKRVLDAAAKPALASTLEHEVTVQALCARTEDFAEGTRAFAEKRQPEFSGR